MTFFGIDRYDPLHQQFTAYTKTQGDYPFNPGNFDQQRTLNREHIHIDLGVMPQDIASMKDQINQMEKALSNFAEILRDALQS